MNWLMVLFLLIIVPLIIGMGIMAQGHWKAVLQQVAANLGISFEPGGLFRGACATGTLDGFHVTVDSYTVRRGKSSTTYSRVRVGTGLPHDLLFEPEGMGASLKKVFVGDDERLGDDAFDGAVVARGNGLQGLLAPETRAAVRATVGGHRAKLKDGTILFSRRGLMRDAGEAIAVVHDCLTMARALRDELSASVPARLEQRTLSDPEPRVRRKALEQLLTYHPTAPETARAAAGALHGGDVRTRLAAARVSGRAGFEVVRELMGTLRTSDELVLAIRTLTEVFLGEPEVPELLEQVIARQQTGDVAQAALEACRARGHAPSEAVLLELTQRSHAGVLREVATALAAYKTAASEAALIALLQVEDTELRIRAAQSLGLSGTTAAVEPLLEYTKGMFVDGDLKSAARAAIAAIQGRLGDVQGGALSLAEEAGAGHLSMVEEAAAVEEEAAAAATRRES